MYAVICHIHSFYSQLGHTPPSPNCLPPFLQYGHQLPYWLILLLTLWIILGQIHTDHLVLHYPTLRWTYVFPIIKFCIGKWIILLFRKKIMKVHPRFCLGKYWRTKGKRCGSKANFWMEWKSWQRITAQVINSILL